MATTISTHTPSAAPKMKRPHPPSIPTGAANPGPDFASPTLGSKNPPSSSTQFPASATSATVNNGMVSRSTARHRREFGRLPHGNQQDATNTLTDGPRGMKRKFREPHVRTTEYILQKHAGSRPSLILHLHPTHFRFEQQDGSFGYNSPMKVFLEHLKAQTIPHDMLEELLNTQVVFYDGCLIVEIHDHKTGAGSMRNKSSGTVGSDQDVPCSIHNYNEHLTPSPYVPYPTQAQNAQGDGQKALANGSADGPTSTADMSEVETKTDKSPRRVFTTVLHPTELSKYREQCILATTPMPERTGRKVAGRDVPTPLSATGPKPFLNLSMVNGKPAKQPKMYLEEKDFHEFEAKYLLATEPPLLLEPAGNFEEALLILKKLEHPLHMHQPAPTKGRKRTATELAADEAQAAEDERMGLIFDERLQPSLGARGGDESVEAANTARDFEPNFSRFKKFEEIKARLEEEKKQRAEAEAQAQITKRQHQEQEAQRRQREEADSQKRDLQRQMMMRQMAQRSNGQMNGQPLNPLLVQQQMLQAQAQAAGSPVMRNQTPTNVSSPLMNNVLNNQAMAHSSSANSHGSPPRPGSVGNMRQMPPQQMARQASQQQSQHGTPHMPNATPQMGNSMPGRVTPQPGMGAGSPTQMQGTPMMGQGMMGTPQMNGQQPQLTAQQRQAYMQQQQISARNHAQQRMASQMQQQQQQQQHMSSPNPNQFGMQMSPHMQQMMASQQQQQHPQANGQQMQGMGGNPQMTAQMAAQMAQQRQSQQYSAQMQARIRQMQGMGAQGQGQQQANGMGTNFSQQQAQQQQGGGMPNGTQMQASMSQHSQNGNAQVQSMQGAQASPNPLQQQQFQQQQQQQLSPAQQQAAQMAARQREQAIKNQFFTRLMTSNGGMLPTNAHDQFAAWKKAQMMQNQQAAQRRAAAAAAAAAASGQGGGMQLQPGQGGGVDPAYVQQLERQRQQMMQQQQLRHQQQQQQQQRMMNGMPPGQ